ncbi:MAG: (d)CMP kinase [Planctomycetota bacterium]
MPDDQPIIITIDGPAGTGKSSVARQLAGRLGLDFLDTGAMYRAATAIAIDHSIVEAVRRGEVGEFLELLLDADLHFDWNDDPPSILAWLRPLNERIREKDVTSTVSMVAAIRTLRKHMVQKQRIIGHQHPRLVTEGRDQGSVVFPNAEVKFYLDAAPEVRAARRAAQERAKGVIVDDAELLASIIERDRLDSSRSDGPLVCPSDAVRIDTAPHDIVGVIGILERMTRDRVESLRGG